MAFGGSFSNGVVEKNGCIVNAEYFRRIRDDRANQYVYKVHLYFYAVLTDTMELNVGLDDKYLLPSISRLLKSQGFLIGQDSLQSDGKNILLPVSY
jgi:hypothetical protein